MASLLLLSFFSIFFQIKTLSLDDCQSICGGDIIRFPFSLDSQTSPRCGFPGFNLSCVNLTMIQNQNQQVLNLPISGKFTVTTIEYYKQRLLINDPDNCIAKRFLKSFDLSGSPFELESGVRDVVFLNCSPSVSYLVVDGLSTPIKCLNGDGYTVVATVASSTGNWPCRVISRVSVPDRWPDWSEIFNGVWLRWRQPNCVACENRGGICGFKGDTGRVVGCSGAANPEGISTDIDYGLFLGVGLPILFVLVFVIWIRLRAYNDQQLRRPTILVSSTTTPQPIIVTTIGLDGPTIESYPKTILDENGRLPDVNVDHTCSICLCEYQPKETLRRIPECNHYFHANCIDVWLRTNASCPVCRNLPSN